MQRKNTRKVYIFIIILTALIGIVNLSLPMDQIMTGYLVVNGEESITYMSKGKAVISMIIGPMIILLLWEYISRCVEKKSQKEPALQSYRIWNGLIDVVFFLWISLPGFMGIISVIQFFA